LGVRVGVGNHFCFFTFCHIQRTKGTCIWGAGGPSEATPLELAGIYVALASGGIQLLIWAVVLVRWLVSAVRSKFPRNPKNT
jgi:hypothetical protein